MPHKHKLIGLVFFLAVCLLLTGQAINSHPQIRRQAEKSDRSLLATVFGESRTVLAERMYYRADVYYHGGIHHADDHTQDHSHGHEHEHHHDCDHCDHEPHDAGEDEVISALEKELGFTDEEGVEPRPDDTAHSHTLCQHDDHHHEHTHSSKHEFNDWWSRLNRRLHPRGHRHLSGKREEKEVLPWLWTAIRIDPENPQPYLDGAYFLGYRLEQPEKALELLGQGIERMPEEVELYFAKGTYLYHFFDDSERAFELLEQGRRHWRELWRQWRRDESAKGEGDEEEPNSLLYFRLLGYLGRISYDSGDLETAKSIYEEAIPFAPSERLRSGVRERVIELGGK